MLTVTDRSSGDAPCPLALCFQLLPEKVTLSFWLIQCMRPLLLIKQHANDFPVEAAVLARSYQAAGRDVWTTPELLHWRKENGESRGGNEQTAV